MVLNRLFQSNSPGSQVIVADATNRSRVIQTTWDFVHQLSQEPLAIEQICQLL